MLLENSQCINDLIMYHAQIAHLGSVGGSTETDTFDRILSAVMTSPLAKMYNWNRLRGKAAFK